MSTTAISSPKNRLPFIKKRPAILLVLLVLAVGAGGALYLIRARQAAATAVPALQVATVRQGSLVISASGSGTLSVSNEIDLAFSTNGQVTAVFVKPGDHVEAGTLLAQIDPQQAQTAFVQARQAYQELTSAAAIATAEQQAAQAQSDLMSARYQLEYLISPEVMYWEAEIAKGQAALTQTKTAAEAAPADQDAQQALKKAKDFLNFAQGKLKEAWNNYDDDYVPKTFRLVEDKLGNDVYLVPTELEIQLARTAIDEAQKALDDSQEYYAVLTGAPMPADASSAALVKLQQVERDLQDAQAVLDGTRITAPLNGTILTVDAAAGNSAGTGTVITMADLGQLELDFYLDASDWGLAAVGDRAEVSFDLLPDETFTGQVTQLDPELYQSGNSSVVKGIVQLDDTVHVADLPVGASASVDVIHARAENILLVPIEALHETAPGKFVVYLAEKGTLTQRPVELGLQDQIYAEVKSGLQAGDVVSTGPVSTD